MVEKNSYEFVKLCSGQDHLEQIHLPLRHGDTEFLWFFFSVSQCLSGSKSVQHVVDQDRIREIGV